MKKALLLLLAGAMLFTLVACVENTTGTSPENTSNTTSQTDEVDTTAQSEADTTAEQVTGAPEVSSEGEPAGWPKNEYTSLVPVPDAGGRTLTDGDMVGELFTIDLEWTIEQGTVYAQQLGEAGFGDDCAEKFEKYGYIDRTANGVNVQLLDLFGTVNISIMKVEE